MVFFRKPISITSALIINVTLLMLLTGIIYAILLSQWRRDGTRDQVQERLQMTAQAISLGIAQSLESRHNEIHYVRDLFENELFDASPSTKRQLIERAQTQRRYLTWMGVVDATGMISVGTHGLLEGKSVAERGWFQGALRAHVYFGDVHPAALLQQHLPNPDGTPLYLLDISFPLHDRAGSVIGVFGSHLNWNMIEKIIFQNLQRHLDTKTISVALINSKGNILFDSNRSNEKNTERSLSLISGAVTEMRWFDSEETYFLTAMDVPAQQNFTGMGWKIVVRESTKPYYAEIASMRWKVAAASLVLSLLFSLLGVLVVRTLTVPLQILVKEIKGFGEHGILPRQNNHVIYEVGNLQQSFVDMTKRVAEKKHALNQSQKQILHTLARAGEFRDNETGNHVTRMSLCCGHLAVLSGWHPEMAEMLQLASQMHDVGKIGIPDKVLLKPGQFDAQERVIMNHHCNIGAEILEHVDTPLAKMAKNVARFHHEKWDGSGYPNGLRGNEIPIEGRIAALCDVFDALLSDRPYKKGWPLDKVIAFISEQAGKQFDPALVAPFIANIEQFVAIRDQYLDHA